MKMKKIFLILLGMPKTLIINFRYFNIKKAIKLPILVSHKVVLKELSGNIIIDSKIRTGMVKIGFETIDIFHPKDSNSIWKVSGTVLFTGTAVFKSGVKINVAKEGLLILGDNLLVNNNTSIVCNKKVHLGKNVLISWECLIMDTDFHKIYNNKNQLINPNKEILIFDDVWIGCNCTILKGTQVGPRNVIAANSVISGELIESNSIYGGIPVKLIKKDIYWKI